MDLSVVSATRLQCWNRTIPIFLHLDTPPSTLGDEYRIREAKGEKLPRNILRQSSQAQTTKGRPWPNLLCITLTTRCNSEQLGTTPCSSEQPSATLNTSGVDRRSILYIWHKQCTQRVRVPLRIQWGWDEIKENGNLRIFLHFENKSLRTSSSTLRGKIPKRNTRPMGISGTNDNRGWKQWKTLDVSPAVHHLLWITYGASHFTPWGFELVYYEPPDTTWDHPASPDSVLPPV